MPDSVKRPASPTRIVPAVSWPNSVGVASRASTKYAAPVRIWVSA